MEFSLFAAYRQIYQYPKNFAVLAWHCATHYLCSRKLKQIIRMKRTMLLFTLMLATAASYAQTSIPTQNNRMHTPSNTLRPI